jgi:hypothetical protein
VCTVGGIAVPVFGECRYVSTEPIHRSCVHQTPGANRGQEISALCCCPRRTYCALNESRMATGIARLLRMAFVLRPYVSFYRDCM